MEIVSSTVTALNALKMDVGTASGAALPDARALARFEEIMQGAQPATDALVAHPMASGLGVPGIASGHPVAAPSLGDRILNGLNGLSSDVQQTWQSVTASLNSPQAMTVTDMLRMQMSLTQLSIQFELVNKAASRSTQNIDQLVKIQ